jgi:hypothetical protein
LALSTGCEGKAAAGNRFRIFGRGPARKGWHSNRASARFFFSPARLDKSVYGLGLLAGYPFLTMYEIQG